MKVIGSYRFVLAGGEETLYGYQPFYGKRHTYLPLVKREVLQVQILCWGALTWINVRESDLSHANLCPTGTLVG